MIKGILAQTAMMAFVQAAEAAEELWNYAKYGEDWGDIVLANNVTNECGLPNNSPIDLPWEMDEEPYPANKDRFKKWYTNQETDI